jgi:hypothetical protein
MLDVGWLWYVNVGSLIVAEAYLRQVLIIRRLCVCKGGGFAAHLCTFLLILLWTIDCSKKLSNKNLITNEQQKTTTTNQHKHEKKK